ncbi:MAG: hypothetical protein QM504_12925, partial [Pseudomonadota bacterium]
MKKKPQWLRDISDKASQITKDAKTAFDEISSDVGSQVKKIDEDYEITKLVKSAGESSSKYISEIEEKYSVSEKAEKAKKSIYDLSEKVSKATHDSGVIDVIESVKTNYNNYVSEPASQYAEESGVNDHIDTFLKKAEQVYGETRAIIKPYYAPETPRELLEKTRDELLYINSCILQ